MDRVRAQGKSPKIKRMAIVAAVVAVIAICALLFGVDFGTYRINRNTIAIETVERGMMDIKVGANGKLQSDNIAQLAAQVSGRVAKLNVKPGAPVEVGQLLVELTNPELVARSEEAQSALEGAMKKLQAARADLQSSMLNQEGVVIQARFNLGKAKLQLEAESRLVINSSYRIVSEIEYKRTKFNVSQAEELYQIEAKRLKAIRGNINVHLAVSESQVAQLARALDRAKNQVANLRVVASIHGIVQAIDVQVGQQLQPGSPIGRVAEQDDLYAELKVPAREAANVRLGQNAVVDTRSGIIKGVVSRIDPGVTDGAVIVDVQLRGKLPASARPQLQIEGTIYIDRIPNTLYVGKPAYVKSDAEIMVYKLDAGGNYADRTRIKVGKVSLNKIQVLAGLVVGDQIITSETGEWGDQKRVLLK